MSMNSELRERLNTLVTRRQFHSGEQKKAEEQVKKLTEEIKAILSDAGLDAADLDRYEVKFKIQSRKSIDAGLLLSAGVDPDIIAASTVETPFTKISVREKKAAE